MALGRRRVQPFKVNCPDCGSVVVGADHMLLMLYPDPTKAYYSWTCPECKQPRSGQLNSALLSVLRSNGVRAVNNFQRETGASGKGPLTPVEATWIASQIDRTDCLAAAVQRWEETDGKNWTPREANGTEGAGGQSAEG